MICVAEAGDRGAVPGPGGPDQRGDCSCQASNRGGKSGRGAGEAASLTGIIPAPTV